MSLLISGKNRIFKKDPLLCNFLLVSLIICDIILYEFLVTRNRQGAKSALIRVEKQEHSCISEDI